MNDKKEKRFFGLFFCFILLTPVCNLHGIMPISHCTGTTLTHIFLCLHQLLMEVVRLVVCG